MEFKTKKDSETGKKLAIVDDKLKEAKKASWDLIKKVGAEKGRQSVFALNGGISEFIFPEGYQVPDYYNKSEHGGHFPDRISEKGKEVGKLIDALPMVSPDELNKIFSIADYFFNRVSFRRTNKEYYLFSIGDNEEFILPEDCEKNNYQRV